MEPSKNVILLIDLIVRDHNDLLSLMTETGGSSSNQNLYNEIVCG